MPTRGSIPRAGAGSSRRWPPASAPIPSTLDRAVDAIRVARTPAERARAERALRRAVVPRYAAWLHVITGLPHGVAFLVELRADLLALRSQDPALGMLDDELTGHLSTLFDVGLLGLRQITWDSPASVLERLMATEAVHAIAGWDDLRHRLDGDQRCYAFFHPALEHEPIVFVEIALMQGLADNLPELLNRAERSTIPTPRSSTRSRRRSPASPGCTSATSSSSRSSTRSVTRTTTSRRSPRCRRCRASGPGCARRSTTDALTPAEEESLGADVGALVELTDRSWIGDPTRAEKVRPGLLSAGARYLTTLRDGRAVDPVANFHLSNGASLERLNWMANPASYGIEESLGLMVNYRYDRGEDRGERGGLPRRGLDQHVVAGPQPGEDHQAVVGSCRALAAGRRSRASFRVCDRGMHSA